jgi:hypothetical protein
MPEASVLIVESDPARVEADLSAGRFGCPGCGGRLAGWGHARWRAVRLVGGVEERYRPRRARCGGCEKTHVLLADVGLARRRDGVEVIGSALISAAGGDGHRRIACRLGVPASTVRGWLRRFRSMAGSVTGFFCAWAVVFDRLIAPLVPSGDALADAVEAVGMAMRAGVARLGRRGPWALVSVLTRGGLLSNTSCLWLAPG